jgi:hypothetical protein
MYRIITLLIIKLSQSRINETLNPIGTHGSVSCMCVRYDHEDVQSHIEEGSSCHYRTVLHTSVLCAVQDGVFRIFFVRCKFNGWTVFLDFDSFKTLSTSYNYYETIAVWLSRVALTFFIYLRILISSNSVTVS